MPLDDIRAGRVEKLKTLREAGTDPYPAKSWRTHTTATVREQFVALMEDRKRVIIAGRIMARREHGGSMFIDIADSSGSLQVYFKKDKVGEREYTVLQQTIDIGDIIEVAGTAFLTKKNEQSLEVEQYRILNKTLLPLPEKWHGIEDVEERLRRRYLDFIMRPEERAMFVKKANFWQATREFLMKEGGLEVETPILEQIPGGAEAEPFVTHMNALNIDLYLRISPELNLKRLIASGFEKVFEIGRIFRNEGIDREHLQDYTQMEMYWAYLDYEDLMKIIERLYKHIIQETIGTLQHTYQGNSIDWSKPWQKIDYYEVFKKHTGLDLSDATEDELIEYAKIQHIDVAQHSGRGRLIDVIFKKKCRPHLLEPGFLVLPPVDVEPLAKRWPKDRKRVERFQVVACGSELGKGFSELNDALDQRQRFEQQMQLRAAGDAEAQRMDEDFVEVLEYGMPPTAGFGMSERLFAFLLDKPVRETVFFPLMRPRTTN